MDVAALFCRSDSIYKSLPGVDVYDIDRNALTFDQPLPVIAHPPCRAWGQLRKLANPRPGEKELAIFAVDTVRKNGGVLEHPRSSTLWPALDLPLPGSFDDFGGWTFPIFQSWFGHKADKPTYLYIVGLLPSDLPDFPLSLGSALYVCGSPGRRLDGSRLHKGDPGWRPEITKAEREHTPPALANWLVSIARSINGARND